MADQNDELRVVWQGQPAYTQLRPDEIRRRVEKMEKRMSRTRYDLYVVLSLSSLVVSAIAALFASPTLVAGAVLLVCGFVYLSNEVRRHAAAAPKVGDGTTVSVEYHRALLQHRLLFHRQGLWRRVFSLLPGGLLFFIGFAGAQPRLVPFIYFQLVTFMIAVLLIIPLNGKAALRLEEQLNDLYRLE